MWIIGCANTVAPEERLEHPGHPGHPENTDSVGNHNPQGPTRGETAPEKTGKNTSQRPDAGSRTRRSSS
jgi:hypothetical protein